LSEALGLDESIHGNMLMRRLVKRIDAVDLKDVRAGAAAALT
jgi:hypothetical protein